MVAVFQAERSGVGPLPDEIIKGSDGFSVRAGWLQDFLEKETALKLWEYLSPSGFPLWSLLRPNVICRIEEKANSYSEDNVKSSIREHLLKYPMEHLRAFSLLFLHPKRDYGAFFLTPAHFLVKGNISDVRNDRVHGSYYSLFSKPLVLEKPQQGNFFRKIEGISPSDVFAIPSIGLIYSLLRRFRSFTVSDEEERIYCELAEKAQKAGDGLLKQEELKRILRKTQQTSWFYEQLARKLAMKLQNRKAFLHCGCYLGGLALFSWHLHNNGFSVIEPQHGYIGASHCAYNYPKEIFNLPGVKRIFPDYFLTFGEKWGEGISIPSEIVPVGNQYLETFSRKTGKSRRIDILVVSYAQVTERMVEITKTLSAAFPERKIVFKLHPREVAFRERCRELESLPNVSMEGLVNKSILPLIAESDVIVGFFSTVLFEALAFQGKTIFCLPHPYTAGETEFNIFHDGSELIRMIAKGGARVSSGTSERYWKKNWSENVKALPFLAGRTKE